MTQMNDEYNDTPPSKTQFKQEADDIQRLGMQLMTFKPSDLARLPLTQSLLNALEEAKRIKSPEARRRHAQFIGKLMRQAEHAAIETAVQKLADPDRHKRLTQWLGQLDDAIQQQLSHTHLIEQLLDWFPFADRQHLMNLIRNFARVTKPEADAGSDGKQLWQQARRKLQAYLTELDRQAPLYQDDEYQSDFL